MQRSSRRGIVDLGEIRPGVNQERPVFLHRLGTPRCGDPSVQEMSPAASLPPASRAHYLKQRRHKFRRRDPYSRERASLAVDLVAKPTQRDKDGQFRPGIQQLPHRSFTREEKPPQVEAVGRGVHDGSPHRKSSEGDLPDVTIFGNGMGRYTSLRRLSTCISPLWSWVRSLLWVYFAFAERNW